ncbi:mycofactocin biosynthesis chaperone MftB [Geodermatophilus sp. URMC 61]|uniref:mycofactocin biosynthesis chaperone MftB n=1 Tax=Geodermatophilus sp. URMC 61 TaxID=3423411 RepID=UPI00406D3593
MRGVLIDTLLAAPAEQVREAGAPPPGPGPAADFDPSLPWRRARSVALRPEPFGALVYHFGNRKLSFLKSEQLVTVVETLAEHPSADAALAACGVPDAQLPAYRRALADLARSQMIEERTSSSPAARELAAGPCDEADPEAHP